MSSRRARARGCEAPFSPLQIGTVLIGVIDITLAIIVFSLYAAPGARAALLGSYCALAAVVAASYLVCACADVTVRGGVPCWCMRATQAKDRYCNTCNALVPGFDHHCAYLNVCVGARTYFFFYVLNAVGFVLFAWHVVACALVAAGPLRAPDVGTGGVVFAAVVSALGAIGVFGLSTLACFHTYLLTQQLGTCVCAAATIYIYHICSRRPYCMQS